MPRASTMTSPQPDAGLEPAWYVQTAGRVWGPYSTTRVARFAIEGRVTSQSLLATKIDGPFHQAGRWRSLASLFQAPKAQAYGPNQDQPASPFPGEPVSSPTFDPPNPKSTPRLLGSPPVSTFAAPQRPLLVWADLSSLSVDQFQALVARYGAVVPIRPTVLLVQARCDAAALRNALSRRLTGADALMIVHAQIDQAAWFNLDSAAERRLRQVWGGGGAVGGIA